jgi:hypothetical protein
MSHGDYLPSLGTFTYAPAFSPSVNIPPITVTVDYDIVGATGLTGATSGVLGTSAASTTGLRTRQCNHYLRRSRTTGRYVRVRRACFFRTLR